MEEVIEELGKIVENSNSKQTEQISSILAEFRLEIKKQGNVPPPTVKLNTSEISHEIKAHLSGLNIKVDDSNLISALKQELKKHDIALEQARTEISNLNSLAHNSIREIRNEKKEKVEIRLKLQNDFYGFTGAKPFSIYILTLIIAFSFAVYSWVKNSDDNRLYESKILISKYEKSVENLRLKNPNIARKYFY